MGVSVIRTSDVKFSYLQVVNPLLLNFLQVAFAKSTTVTQYKISDNHLIIKGM